MAVVPQELSYNQAVELPAHCTPQTRGDLGFGLSTHFSTLIPSSVLRRLVKSPSNYQSSGSTREQSNSNAELLQRESHLALGGPMDIWPLLCGTKRAAADGAPTREGREGHPGARDARLARFGSRLHQDRRLGAGDSRAGPTRCAPRLILRPAPGCAALPCTAITLLLLPIFLLLFIIFPRKARRRDCADEPRRGRHFPGKAQRASAPGAPEREPEGSVRPRARPGHTPAAASGARRASPADLPRHCPRPCRRFRLCAPPLSACSPAPRRPRAARLGALGSGAAPRPTPRGASFLFGAPNAASAAALRSCSSSCRARR